MQIRTLKTKQFSLARASVILLTLVMTASCQPQDNLALKIEGPPIIKPDPKPTPTPSPTPDPETPWVAPLWEEKSAANKPWTTHSAKVVETHGASLLLATDDTLTFCPAYFSLAPIQKVNFWVYFVSTIVRYESNFKTTTRYLEGSLGTDRVTKEPVYSEGLLQLSYGDSLNYTFCNEFNWAVDSKLSRTDPKKTIFDPMKNLSCGIRILDRMVERQGKIAAERGQYWSTLLPGHKNNKLEPIRQLTNKLPFCVR